MDDFNARTGTLDDCLQIDGEIKHIKSRAKTDTKINTNSKLIVVLCKTTEIAILNGRIGKNKHIGEYTCVTHNGKSSNDYFLAEYSCFDSVLNISVKTTDPSLSNVHYSLVLELAYIKVSPMAQPLPSQIQMKGVRSEVKKVELFQHLRTRDFPEIQTCVEDELKQLR